MLGLVILNDVAALVDGFKLSRGLLENCIKRLANLR
jgi:hypothetical protein